MCFGCGVYHSINRHTRTSSEVLSSGIMLSQASSALQSPGPPNSSYIWLGGTHTCNPKDCETDGSVRLPGQPVVKSEASWTHLTVSSKVFRRIVAKTVSIPHMHIHACTHMHQLTHTHSNINVKNELAVWYYKCLWWLILVVNLTGSGITKETIFWAWLGRII